MVLEARPNPPGDEFYEMVASFGAFPLFVVLVVWVRVGVCVFIAFEGDEVLDVAEHLG